MVDRTPSTFAENNAPADTFLARRFNMLGFPGERNGGAISYPGLRAELGDDNAAALVTRIGEMVNKQGLESLGVPLHHAVDRIVQSLSPDERRTMAEGGTVARVQALISAEVTTAKLQQNQAPRNIHGAGSVDATARDLDGRLFGLMSSRGGNQFAALRDKGGASAATDTGVAGVYKALGSEGFTRTQIAGAIDYAKSIGIADPSYAGYFVGSSKKARNAIAAHIRDGKQITDDEVEKPEDVTAVIGAVKADKIKPEEAPPSVQNIMGQMKKDGVDPVTAPPKAIRKWMKEHPKALDEAKKEALDRSQQNANLDKGRKIDALVQLAATAPDKDDKSKVSLKPDEKKPTDTKPQASANAGSATKSVKLGL